MSQRETGPIPSEFCLWKPLEGENEGWYVLPNSPSQSSLLILQRYLHEVTKAKTRIHSPETGGGILADEMGMGKSLSTLALITKTLEDAQNWMSLDSTDSLKNAHVKQTRSRATLVIVPSASMSLAT